MHQFRKDFVRLSDQKVTQQNVRSTVGKWRAITGHKYVSKLLKYFRELILLSTSVKVPTP
jgi:hypothetical protein